MRSVNYEVKTADGATFHTMDYTLATQSGNRIVKTYLSDIDEKTEKQKKRQRERVNKLKRG